MSWWERNFKKALQGAVNFLGNVDIDGTLNVGGNICVSGNTGFFTDTSDGNDNAYIAMCGGGALSYNRGAEVVYYGNEHADYPGHLALYAGNVTTGDIWLFTPNAAGEVQTYIGTYQRQRIYNNSLGYPTIQTGALNAGNVGLIQVGGTKSAALDGTTWRTVCVLEMEVGETFMGHAYITVTTAAAATFFDGKIFEFVARYDNSSTIPTVNAADITTVPGDPGVRVLEYRVIGVGTGFVVVQVRETGAGDSGMYATASIVGSKIGI